jgi:hypothetical protein
VVAPFKEAVGITKGEGGGFLGKRNIISFMLYSSLRFGDSKG